MKKNELLQKALEYFQENEEIFNQCLEEMDAYNGYLGDDRTYSMDDFNELLQGKEPLELASMVAYGDFNPYHDYFYFTAYGHIKTSPYIDYTDKLDIYTVEDIVEFIAGHGTIDALCGEAEIEEILEELLKEE